MTGAACTECGSHEQVTALTEHLDLCRACHRVFVADVVEFRRLLAKHQGPPLTHQDVTEQVQTVCGWLGGGLLLVAALVALAWAVMSV